jgi:hypothetical protein
MLPSDAAPPYQDSPQAVQGNASDPTGPTGAGVPPRSSARSPLSPNAFTLSDPNSSEAYDDDTIFAERDDQPSPEGVVQLQPPPQPHQRPTAAAAGRQQQQHQQETSQRQQREEYIPMGDRRV